MSPKVTVRRRIHAMLVIYNMVTLSLAVGYYSYQDPNTLDTMGIHVTHVGTVASLLSCAVSCSNNKNCHGFAYRTVSKGCKLLNRGGVGVAYVYKVGDRVYGDFAKDVNECLQSNGGCSHVCKDTKKSNTCSCNPGYKLNGNGHSCDDVDECTQSNGGCEQICTNKAGGRDCSCKAGYKLNANGRSCDVVDKCMATGGGCDHICKNMAGGGVSCSCNAGYKLNADGYTCDGVDKCMVKNGGCQHICTNAAGIISCSCRSGYILNANGHSCDDCYVDHTPGSYQGNISVTETGRQCQRWDVSTPHAPTVGHTLPHNFCRVEDEIKPWCYTIDKAKRWEFCSVPMCPKVGALRDDMYCHNGWTKLVDMCYTFESCDAPNCTHVDATGACAKLNATLINVKTREIDSLLHNNKKNDAHYWIGGSGNGTKDTWEWTDGAGVGEGYVNWKVGQPGNDLGGEHCMTSYKGVWADEPCALSRDGYGCERPTQSYAKIPTRIPTATPLYP